MFSGINPRQMKQAMKKMGMEQEELDVIQVIFRFSDKEMIINNPQVSKINMMGQESFQVVGSIEEKAVSVTPDISDEDIETVVDQTGCSRKEAEKALEEHEGDLAAAIMSFQN